MKSLNRFETTCGLLLALGACASPVDEPAASSADALASGAPAEPLRPSNTTTGFDYVARHLPDLWAAQYLGRDATTLDFCGTTSFFRDRETCERSVHAAYKTCVRASADEDFGACIGRATLSAIGPSGKTVRQMIDASVPALVDYMMGNGLWGSPRYATSACGTNGYCLDQVRVAYQRCLGEKRTQAWRLCAGRVLPAPPQLGSAAACAASTFQPAYWNDGGHVQNTNNCYNYAVNRRTDTFAVPGRASGKPYFFPEEFFAAIASDGLVEVGKNASCPAPFSKVVVIAQLESFGTQFHWARQDRDGTWSGKNANDPAVQYGPDPEAANADADDDVRYYCVCSSAVEGAGTTNVR